MEIKTIMIRVDAAVAQMYESASEDDRRKLNALLSLKLREIADKADKSRALEEVIHEISHKAQQRGLTPEILDAILNEQ